MKISACLITKNEEENIRRCIDSFRTAVDEIVVVDTGSTDKTVSLARKLGSKIHFQKWDNNFAKARNSAISKAKGDWIVFLDADEYFSDNCGLKLRSVLKEIHRNKEVDSLYLKVSHLDDNGHIKCSSYIPRIFRNNGKIRYHGRIHETISRLDRQLNVVYVPENELSVIHLGYTDQEKFEGKCQRNLQILLSELQSGNDSPSIQYHLSDTYYGLKNYQPAIKHAKEYINRKIVSNYDIKLYINLIKSMIQVESKFEEIFPVINDALSRFPNHPDLHMTIARVMLWNKRYREAYTALEKTVYVGFNCKDRLDYSDWPSYLCLVYYQMGLIHELKNEFSKAQDYFVKSLHENKFNPEALTKLLSLIKGRAQEQTTAILNGIYDEKVTNEIEFLVTYIAKLRVNSVFNYYYNLLYKKTGHEHFTLLFLLLTNKQFDEAFEYLLDCYSEAESNWIFVLLLVSAMMSNDLTKINKVKIFAKPSFRKIIESYYDCVELSLSEEETSDYIDLLNEFIYLDAQEKIEHMLRLVNSFETDLLYKAGELFMNANLFQAAIEQFKRSLAHVDSNNAELYFQIGFCYYKLCDYGQAVEYLTKAQEKSYNEDEIFELLFWTREQSNSSL